VKPAVAGAIGPPEHLQGLRPYEPGVGLAQARRLSGRDRIARLGSNENPLGPSPLVIEALADAAASLHRYPDGGARALRAALAERAGVSPSQVVVGCGSSELIDCLARAMLGPEDAAVVSEAAFPRFLQVVMARNRRARVVPMRDSRHDTRAMAAAARDARLVFVANPNNPTGTWNRRDEIESLIDALPPRALLVLDEAYHEYVDDPEIPDGLDFVRAGAPVAVLRTFSKIHGLAGLRVGCAYAPETVIEAVDIVREPFDCSSLAQRAALAALGDAQHVRRSAEANRAERARLREALLGIGCAVLPSQTNFLFCDAGAPSAEVFEALLARGVIVRPFRGEPFPSWLRVSIGSREDDDLFLEALAALRRSR
jgi:histidinol-phosphate aminotransferase